MVPANLYQINHTYEMQNFIERKQQLHTLAAFTMRIQENQYIGLKLNIIE